MILPGVSGAYLLIVLGQWVVILGAIEAARQAVADGNWSGLGEPMWVFVPVAVGVLIGVVGVSNVIKVCLQRYRRATLGVLLGLLLGAVAGLWPFQELTLLEDGSVHREGFFAPSVLQAIAALGLITLGFAVSMGVAMLGGDRNNETG